MKKTNLLQHYSLLIDTFYNHVLRLDIVPLSRHSNFKYVLFFRVLFLHCAYWQHLHTLTVMSKKPLYVRSFMTLSTSTSARPPMRRSAPPSMKPSMKQPMRRSAARSMQSSATRSTRTFLTRSAQLPTKKLVSMFHRQPTQQNTRRIAFLFRNRYNITQRGGKMH